MDTKIEVLLESARRKEMANNIKGAIEDYKLATVLDTENEKAFFEMGKLFYKLGKLTNALNAFYKTLDINPKHEKAKVNVDMINSILNFYNKDMYNP